jgi:HTH-type transcriptional regulator / antitoxin HigA
MSTTANQTRKKTAPTTFDALVREWMPTAIHDKAAYNNAMEMVRRLAVVPALNADQQRYLDTLCVLVAAYEKQHRTIGTAKPKPLDVLREFVAEHGIKVRELGAILGVSESAASMILKGDRALTINHVRRLSDRFKVSAALLI